MLNIQELLTQIRKQIDSSHEKVISFSKTHYSYEEWINWEIFDALSKSGYECKPKPSYKRHGKSVNERYQADIYGEGLESGSKFIMEVALVGISTQSKWRKKIERDREKLSGFVANDKGLKKIQLLVLAADYPNVLEEWEYWLKCLNFWQENKPMIEVSSSRMGEVVICGWSIAT